MNRKQDHESPEAPNRFVSHEALRNYAHENTGFSLVGIGASAGGLEALKAFVSHLPETTGLAYIILMHTSPDHQSLLPDLLQKSTRIPVSTAQDEEIIQPDHIYVIPPGKEINIFHNTIYLLDRAERDSSLPIDFFFRSLAQDQKEYAAGIILSGTGTDGTQGVREIKFHEGFVMAQSPDSAKYDGMPQSAIRTGVVDLILSPQEMPEKLVHYYHRRFKDKNENLSVQTTEHPDWLTKIFSLIRTRIGHDFSAYKKNTLHRRIKRRMDLNQIKDHQAYIRYLRENPNEMDALFRELLIGVTSFFREPESFEALKNDVIPDLLTQKEADSTFRAWIPGCSTGEEAYSLAIILGECLDRIPRKMNIQLFATDIDKHAIDQAREGIYPATIAADVSEERLRRFFIKEDHFYRVSKEIRECIVFSVHDVLTDPPFSRLDLLCCRNLLIYLEPETQKTLLPLFHYTLNSEGVLMLGSSETVGKYSNLFQPLEKKWKIYKRREVPLTLKQQITFPTGSSIVPQHSRTSEETRPARDVDMGRSVQKVILERFSPASVLVDSKGNILHFQGDTSKYLRPVTGPPNQGILDMAREGLRIELSSALRNTVSSGEEERRRGISVKRNDDVQKINLRVIPIRAPRDVAGNYLVVFEDLDREVQTATSPDASHRGGEQGEQARIAELEEELQKTRETHQSTVEELESSNEELKSTNEELQSSNEELQSTNEELESSKEELQSLNEELQTVNSELQNKVEELAAAYDDMNNLLQSTQISTIFVDNDLNIRRYTEEATKIVNLIQSDLGRPLHHVSTNLQENLIPDIREVLNKLASIEKEIVTNEDEWFKMNILPYRTMDNRIDGAILTFSNIDEQKKTQERLRNLNQELQQAWLLVRRVFDMNRDPLAVLNHEGHLVIANTTFYNLMNVTENDVEGKDVFTLKQGILEQTDLKKRLKEALNEGRDFESTTFHLDGPNGKQAYSVDGEIIRHESDMSVQILLRIREATLA
jgi:two-component system CheB/CheR fusion protein